MINNFSNGQVVQIDEFEVYFAFNQHRKQIISDYKSYMNDFLKQIKGKILLQWIGGSYITTKEYPSDIDVVTFIEHPTNFKIIDGNYTEELKEPLVIFNYPNSRNNFKWVDGYIFPQTIREVENKKEYNQYYRDYWHNHFKKYLSIDLSNAIK